MKTEGRNAVAELLKTDKNIDKILMEKGPSLVLVTLGFQAIGESLGRLMDPGSAHE